MITVTISISSSINRRTSTNKAVLFQLRGTSLLRPQVLQCGCRRGLADKIPDPRAPRTSTPRTSSRFQDKAYMVSISYCKYSNLVYMCFCLYAGMKMSISTGCSQNKYLYCLFTASFLEGCSSCVCCWNRSILYIEIYEKG